MVHAAPLQFQNSIKLSFMHHAIFILHKCMRESIVHFYYYYLFKKIFFNKRRERKYINRLSIKVTGKTFKKTHIFNCYEAISRVDMLDAPWVSLTAAILVCRLNVAKAHNSVSLPFKGNVAYDHNW